MAGAADINAFNENVIKEFRRNNGAVDGPFAGAPLLLLTMKGAKSGRERTAPVVYTQDGDRYVIVASKGGAPTHPDWYFNLRAHPEVTVEVPGEKFRARAVVAEGTERDRLFRAHADHLPNFDEYRKKTDRVLPVIILERID